MTSTRVRALWSSSLVVIVGAGIAIGFILFSANLDTAAPRQHLIEAFQSGVLSHDTYRELEVVPGFIVMESDSFSSCVMYSQMLAPADSVFATGVWLAANDRSCGGLARALAGEPATSTSWYRYWHGASAISKVVLTVLPVQAAEILLTLVLLLLVVTLVSLTWRTSRTFAVGLATIFVLTSDTLWQGMSLVHGISTAVGLAGATATLIAFRREWAGRWGVVVLAGFSYAVVAQMLLPIAFAITCGVVAMLPFLSRSSALTRLMAWRGLAVAGLWVGGYALGLGSRYVWVQLAGPGLDVIRAELTATAEGGFRTHALIDPFYGVVGLLTKTWFGVGWMQIGLMAAFLVMGWSLGRGAYRGLKRPEVLISLTPIGFGLAWLAVWAGHTNHTFVHTLLSCMLLNVMFAIELARRLASPDDNVPVSAEHVVTSPAL
jgi:hypothetical protein